MYTHTVRSPQTNHELKGRISLYRIRETTHLFWMAMKAVFDPNVISFEFDKRPRKSAPPK